jgi:hypothetical protein
MRVVYACDIGTTLQNPPNFGWARVCPDLPADITGSRDIQQLVDSITGDASRGMSIAIGFEAPCFLPVPVESTEFSRARNREGDRAWSVAQGLSVTTLGIHQSAWIMRSLHKSMGHSHRFTTDWNLWPPSNRCLLLVWEAFVSGTAHSPTNDPTQDATTAVTEFIAHENNLDTINAVDAFPRISLIHAVALWSGWSDDLSGLHDTALVVRPTRPFNGDITAA